MTTRDHGRLKGVRRLVRPERVVVSICLTVAALLVLGGCNQETAEQPMVSTGTTDNGVDDVAGGPPTDASVAVSTDPNDSDLVISDASPENRNTSAKEFVRVESLKENFRGTNTLRRTWHTKVYTDNSRELHGEYIEYYDDGTTVFEKGEFQDGKRSGAWVRYHKNGKPAKEGSYLEGKLHGKWSKFDEQGVLQREETYKDGMKDGTWLIYYPDGKTVAKQYQFKNDKRNGKEIQWRENGEIALEMDFVDGRLHGQRKTFALDGARSVENFQNGRRHGTSTSWNSAGTIVDRKEFENGRQLPDL